MDNNNKGKVSTFLGILLLVSFSFALLGLSSYFLLSYEKEKKARQGLEEQFNLIKEEKDRIQKELDDAKIRAEFFEREIKKNEKTISDLETRLDKDSKERVSLIDTQAKLMDKILGLEQEKVNLKELLNDKLLKLEQLENQLEEMTLANKKREEALLRQSKEGSIAEDLDKIVVSPSVSMNKADLETQIPPDSKSVSNSSENESSKGKADSEKTVTAIPNHRPSLSSTVLLVNREYDFIILDVGKSGGVAIEDIFEVFHKGKSLGKVRVEKVHELMCAAKFLEGFQENEARESDIANRIN